jgi:hypothetical protein
MYYLVAFIIVVMTLFLVYTFYPQINTIVKQNLIPSQNVIHIKKEMEDLDHSSNPEPPKKEEISVFSKINAQMNELLHLPIDFLYKLIDIYVTPLFYNI